MIKDFNDLPDDSRLWIYQSNRKLSNEELAIIEPKIIEFLKQWTAHGKELDAGYEIKYNRFIVLGLNQENASASGCSIDASVNFIQSLEKEFGINLMDKLNVTYYNGDFIAHKSLIDFIVDLSKRKICISRVVSPIPIGKFNDIIISLRLFSHKYLY